MMLSRASRVVNETSARKRAKTGKTLDIQPAYVDTLESAMLLFARASEI
jgi:hypothetical protein